MTAPTPESALSARSVGDIAATLPGATAVFRRFRIDFCCNGDLALGDAARRRGVDPGEVGRALAALDAGAAAVTTAATLDSGALIDHIERRYHEAHRRTLPELIALSRKVEAVHRHNPKAPAGLAEVLRRMEAELEEHMAREESTLFPAMRQAAGGGLDAAIGALRHEHDGQGALLRELEAITDDFTLPEGACRSWQALYIGTARLAEEVMEHIHLENNVLFPRFSPPAGRA